MYYYVKGKKVEVDLLGSLSEASELPVAAETPFSLLSMSDRAATEPGEQLSRGESEFLASIGLSVRTGAAPFAATALRPGSRSEREKTAGRTLVRDRETGQLHVIGRRMVARFAANLDEATIDRILAENRLLKVGKLYFATNLLELMTADEDECACFRAGELQESLGDRVVYIEPVSTCSYQPRHKPDDEFYGAQWQWNNLGLSRRAVAGADVRAEAAWDVSKGEGTVIAVIDRGFHVNDQDIAVNIDHDRSALFSLEGPPERGVSRMPVFSHGTFSAAQAAAQADDGVGTCGIAPNAKLMLLGLEGGDAISQYVLARAIAYAVSPRKAMGGGFPEKGADVLTCAEGPTNGFSRLESVLDDALDYAFKEGRGGKGMPVFWAVANKRVHIENDQMVSHRHVIAVGSSTIRDKRARNCAYGPGLAFIAPGSHVFNLRGSDDDYGPDSGTSFATPIAAGIAALMLSKNPELSAQQVRAEMEKSCRRVSAMGPGTERSDFYGWGVINAKDCVDAAIKGLTPIASAASD